ncbi:hypothetical protein [Chitinimonas sp. BJB300]|uniref:hypothetical protein n=1 Tax=Chitinimonas sp. BJB300 TaxID=1559339 RepID=UPI000C108BD9|nr:hypothetical protein [Chitinimonas sp. BJB300]PHV11998.1 hypothetical protein CSQ89_08015 [Chitinimonas sp. BJB300]TSJ91441.1 hypothetical protein FG002_003960 [Chitinimonas sp. BJB300]
MSLLKLAFILFGLLMVGLGIQRLRDPQAARRQRLAGVLLLLAAVALGWIAWHGVDIHVP